MRLILLLVGVPLLELVLLIQVTKLTSWTFTIGLTLLTGVVGASLARRQGFSVIRRIQSEMSAGKMPTSSIVDAVMILIAGLLLMTPGILTDIFGFSLLVPVCRRIYQKIVMEWIRRNVKVQTFTSVNVVDADFQESRSEIIDSYVIEHDSKIEQ